MELKATISKRTIRKEEIGGVRICVYKVDSPNLTGVQIYAIGIIGTGCSTRRLERRKCAGVCSERYDSVFSGQIAMQVCPGDFKDRNVLLQRSHTLAKHWCDSCAGSWRQSAVTSSFVPKFSETLEPHAQCNPIAKRRCFLRHCPKRLL